MQQQERRLALRLAVSLPHPPPTHQPRAGEEKGLTGLVQASSTEQRKLFMELRGTKSITCINAAQRLTELCTRIHLCADHRNIFTAWRVLGPLLPPATPALPAKAAGRALGWAASWRKPYPASSAWGLVGPQTWGAPPGTPAPCLAFTPLGHSSYSLVQSERRLRAPENMKSVCLNVLVLLRGFLKRRRST